MYSQTSLYNILPLYGGQSGQGGKIIMQIFDRSSGSLWCVVSPEQTPYGYAAEETRSYIADSFGVGTLAAGKRLVG
jgi:hypothetical protein